MKLEEEIKQVNFKSQHQKLVVNIIYTANWLNYLHTQLCKKHNISVEQFNILRILRGQYPNAATINLLIDRMLNKMSNASRLVEKLRLKGMVERQINKGDRRACNVLITKKGLDVLTEMDKEENENRPFLANLNEDEAKQLNVLLDKLRET